MEKVIADLFLRETFPTEVFWVCRSAHGTLGREQQAGGYDVRCGHGLWDSMVEGCGLFSGFAPPDGTAVNDPS